VKLESILQYLEGYLGVSTHPDYPTALYGLQIEGRPEVQRLAVAVDASVASIEAAVELGADLMIVHHGLFWGGLQPLTGRHLARIRPLIESGTSLYSCHLPLDAHVEVGNCALLARSIGVEPEQRFAPYQGVPIGWWGRLPEALELGALEERVRAAVDGRGRGAAGGPGGSGGPGGTAGATAGGWVHATADAAARAIPAGSIHTIAGGPARIERVGVVTGGGASFVRDAAALGLDAFVTGEGPHHTYFDAVELGIHVLLAGHYATETFGVKALAAHLEERFGLEWTFIDQPTGL
jgi:dinuclear metal center YbgI/SA1388 family protein